MIRIERYMKLIIPSVEYKSQYLDMMDDWISSKENLVPFPLKYDTTDFLEFVNKCNRFNTQKDEGFVHHSTFWFEDDNRIVGVSNVRHYLNDQLLVEGGHIGYGVRPSCRKMGYATKILELSLVQAKKLGIQKALITCDKYNIGSSKTIIKNGGILWKEHVYEGRKTLNFWIEIN